MSYMSGVLYRVDAVLAINPLPSPYDFSDLAAHLYALHLWCLDRRFEWPRSYSDTEAVARFQDDAWVRKYVKTQILRADEEDMRFSGSVSRRYDPYCSSRNKIRVLESQESFLKHAAGVSMTSSSGRTATLLDLVNAGTANPENRRSEMMVRVRGLEKIATDSGMVGLFLTNTVPGRMHPTRHSGLSNKNWDGSTVRDCQAQLTHQWALLRARCAKDSIHYFGLRVAEPHHDGTPHWHMLVFVRADQVDSFVAHFREVSVMGSESDRGAFAAKHRYKIVYIDPQKGSAVGYVAKYVSKNIDGKHVSEESSSASVRAWASLHGIRQFQFFGAVSVQLWREARRLSDDISGHLGIIRDYAKNSDYASFSAEVMSSCSAVQLVRDQSSLSRFGDIVPGRILGLEIGDQEAAQTRFDSWARGIAAATPLPWTRLNNCNSDSLDDVRAAFTDSEDLDKAAGWSDEQEFFPNLLCAGTADTSINLRQ